ncbi:MAG: zinc-ribbon domain-containing protein [Roseiflexaceae bacterium]|nr:zinc-ribbon domain-containing protein [Roseiflexaceae bacterium]
MSFLDNITKRVTQGVERAKFEADKIQRTLKMEAELGDLKKQLDGKRLEFGDRALELYRAGMIQSPTLGAILREIEAFQQKLTLKEEELKIAQSDQFTEPRVIPPAPTAQHVPVSVEAPVAQAAPPPSTYNPQPPTYNSPPPVVQPTSAPQSSTKSCPNCQFQMPSTAVFCPSCGTRVS